jgi:hypothetical protein
MELRYKSEDVGGCLKGLQRRLNGRDAFYPQKGVIHALDNIGDSLAPVVSGSAHELHDGWAHSYPAFYCHPRVGGPSCSGTRILKRFGS